MQSRPEFKPEEYMDLIDDLDMTKEQKEEYLLNLWNFCGAVMDMTLRTQSAQLAQEQNIESASKKQK